MFSRASRRDEVLGELDEILGDERYEETVGAPLPVRYPGYGMPPGMRVGSQTVVGSRAYSKGRQLALPIDSVTNVAASATAIITTRPQTLFRAERFVTNDPNGNFLINDIRVGKNSMFLNSGSIPAAVFAANAFGVRLKMDTAQVAMDISVSVTNTDGGAGHRFNGVIIGASVE